MGALATYEDYAAFKAAVHDLGVKVQVWADRSSVGGGFTAVAVDSSGSLVVAFSANTKPGTFNSDFPHAVEASSATWGA